MGLSLVRKLRIAAFAVLAVLFLLSLVILLLKGETYRQVILFFPGISGQIDEPEVHYIPNAGDDETSLRLLIEEILLGPIDILRKPIVDSGTQIRGIFVHEHERRIMLSFSREIMQAIDGYGIDEDLQSKFFIIEKNVTANFPWYRTIGFLVEGQELDVPPYYTYNTSNSGDI